MKTLRRWWSKRCWVVRSGVDSTWRRSNVDVQCAWWVPQSIAIRRARESIELSFPSYHQRAILVGAVRWREVSGTGHVYRGWRVVFDKSGIFRAIYGFKPPAGI